MAVTVLAAWLVLRPTSTGASSASGSLLASNALWVAWGWQTSAWALIVLQICLAALNIRGVVKAALAADS